MATDEPGLLADLVLVALFVDPGDVFSAVPAFNDQARDDGHRMRTN